jgi:uncharacterized coiled-coil protein SlyX
MGKEKMVDQTKDTEQENTGLPSDSLDDNAVSIPNLTADADDDVANSGNQIVQKPVKKASLWPLLIVLGLFFLFIGALGFAAVKFVSPDKNVESVTQVENINNKADGKEKGGATAAIPQVKEQEVPEAVIPKAPDYVIGNKSQADSPDLPKSASNIDKKLDEVIEKLKVLDEIESRLDRLEQSQSQTNQAVDSLKDNVGAVTMAVEQIADYLRKNAGKLDDIKTSFSNAKTLNETIASTPQFRVAGKSVYGDTVYLTVTNDDNFSSQITVGGRVGSWTLKSVDLASKNSHWSNKQGVRREISIP